ncbi:MAG: ribbon-helix-helix domain-containing protein [Hyphomicrobiaceae bacterium]
MAKRASLTKLGLARHVAPKGEAPAAPKIEEGGKPRHLQIRLNDAGWQELKLLSVAERRPLQALMMEALNDLLRKYGRGPMVEGKEE